VHRPGRAIDITLRSTPSGALAAVDGTPIGYTPTFWPGESDGREHEFTFVLPGHAVGRYRFVPVTSGVVHARLEPITEEADAGVALEPVPSAGPERAPPPPPPPAPAVATPIHASPPPDAPPVPEGSGSVRVGPER